MAVPPDFFPISRMPHSILSETAYRSRSHENSPKQLPRHERGVMLPVRRTGRQDGCLLESDRKQRFNLSIKHIKDVKFAPDLCHKNNGVKRVASSNARPLSATEKDDAAIIKIKHATTSHNSP